MRKKVASRKLQRRCIECSSPLNKGNVYYIQRNVYNFFGEVVASEYLLCPKCKYKAEQSSRRYKEMISEKRCKHPIGEIVWQTIAGEDYVKEPSHEECLVCREII